MARCLRCHAGNEWIEGRTPGAEEMEELKTLRALMMSCPLLSSQYRTRDWLAWELKLARYRNGVRRKQAEAKL
jgi:hypothetical protein